MAGRQTNLALLALTGLAVLSGFGAFAMGTKTGRWVVVAHGLIGLAMLLLAPWKTTIARRGLTRQRASRVVSLALAVASIVAIASGVLQTTGVTDHVGPLTLMQVHVGSGLVALVLVLAHFAQRPVRPRAADLSRRALIRTGGLLSAAAVLWAANEGLLRWSGARGWRRRFTGSHEITDPGQIPVTQWLNDTVPALDRSDYRITVAGMLHSIDDLSEFGDEVEATLDCTGGWYTTQRWSGVYLDRLLIGADGQSILVRSVTGYWRRFPLTEASRLLLATSMGDSPLSAGHGGPVRIVAPGRRGFWWVKWVESVEVDKTPPWWQPPLPTA